MSPAEEAAFLGDHLGPTLKAQHPEVGIFVHDDQKNLLPDYLQAVLEHPTAAEFVEGAGFHWYSGDFFDKVAWVHGKFPNVKLLSTEATYEKRLWRADAAQTYSDWSFGEGYAHDIIGDLNAGAVGWIDWNLLLDRNGGPNHVGNVCDAAVVANVQAQQLELHPQYYYIGHFSKFIPSGSKRIEVAVRSAAKSAPSLPPRAYGACTGQDGLEVTSFLRPDEQIVAVVLNCADASIDFKLRHGGSAVGSSIPPHAIQTYLLPK